MNFNGVFGQRLKKSVLQKAFSGQLSELGFNGLKDHRIVKKDKEEILKSTNHRNHNSDNDGLKDDRIIAKKEILQSTNPKNHNSDKKLKV